MPEHPAVGVLRSAGAAHEVPPIVDDNEEFQLDISEPSIPIPSHQAPAAELPRPVPPQSPAQSAPLSAPFKRSTDPEPGELELVEPKPERRARVDRRRSDRRFSSLLDEKGSAPSYSDDDDYSIGRTSAQPAANAGLAKIMFGLGALALGFKIWYFIHVAGMWNLAQMPDFIVEQVFSGIALVGLIVLALSSMKK